MTTQFKTYVRCSSDKMVFRVDPVTLQTLSCSTYDPYCYTDPDPQIKYIEFFDWLREKARK